MITEDSSLLRKKSLSEIAEAISAEYLIVYDEKGAETACSREYTGFTLPEDPEDPFYDFRRLLKGIPVIVHEPGKRYGLERRLPRTGFHKWALSLYLRYSGCCRLNVSQSSQALCIRSLSSRNRAAL